MISQSVSVPAVPVFPVYWLQSPKRGPTHDAPESFFIFGNPNTGKSNQGMAHMTNFLANGHKGIDAFGSDVGAEELVWFFSPYKDKTVMLHGDDVEVDTGFPKMKISDFTLDALHEYDLAVTTRELFGEGAFAEIAHYHALAKLFNLCQNRKGFNSDWKGTVIALMIREAWNVIYSQIRAGISKDEQDAQRQLKKLDKQRFHTGIAPILDSQRYMDIDTSVRQLANFRIIKGFGGQVIPDEFNFLFKPHLFLRTPWKLRNLPPDEFIMVTSWNGVATGLVDKVPWTHKGEDLMKSLKIVVHPPPEKEEPTKPEVKTPEHPFRRAEEHNRIVDLHNQGLNYTQIEKELAKEGVTISWQKARYHVLGLCSCKETQV